MDYKIIRVLGKDYNVKVTSNEIKYELELNGMKIKSPTVAGMKRMIKYNLERMSN